MNDLLKTPTFPTCFLHGVPLKNNECVVKTIHDISSSCIVLMLTACGPIFGEVFLDSDGDSTFSEIENVSYSERKNAVIISDFRD